MLNRTPGLTFEIDHLRAFIAVVESQTQQQAAKRLHISQPCLCKKMQRLQGVVKATLWRRRVPVVLELTPAGQQFFEDAKRIVGLVDALATRLWDDDAAQALAAKQQANADRAENPGAGVGENLPEQPKTDVAL